MVVDPHLLYGQHYTYRSGINPGWSEHCRDLALEIVRLWLDTPFEGGRHLPRLRMIDDPGYGA